MRVFFSPRAVDRLLEIEEFHATSSTAKAKQVVAKLKNSARSLAAMPRMGRMVLELGDPEVRELVVAPYRLVYTVRDDAVEVLTIVHGRQRFPLDEFLSD